MRKESGNGLQSLLGQGVECDGSARVEGTLRLDGSFQGRLEVGESLIIGHSGRFVGQAIGRTVVIAGSFEGEVMGTDQVELQKGARLHGDVLTRSLVIEPGVYFEGSCRMEFTEADEARLRVDAVRKGFRGGEPDEDDEEQGDLVRSLSN
ncbi:MAG TPA: polymer-forming cytoskeletal protein [Gemmatimonadota bacterium]|nr:polymer-forming cytoskeletal protein [Gemmatimonadota bacterium]